ncbi:MAG: NYN domain-containing protein [Patescibacteria group bacterium]|nr:NYN domain-containing protein [Patescibacteria group bacterium]
MSDKQVAIFIDGSNFYHRSARFIPKGKRIDYVKLAELLSGVRDCRSKRFYIGILRNYNGTDEGERLVEGQRRFLGNLARRDGYVVKKGRMHYDDGVPGEKGVDVKIAIDLVVGAIDDLFDTAILVSSDTDLIPAVKYAQYKGKQVEYVAVGHVSYNLKEVCYVTTELTSADIAGICV